MDTNALAIYQKESMTHLTSVSFDLDNSPTQAVYPFNLPIFYETRQLTFSSPVTFFSGENGTGKSTLEGSPSTIVYPIQ